MQTSSYPADILGLIITFGGLGLLGIVMLLGAWLYDKHSIAEHNKEILKENASDKKAKIETFEEFWYRVIDITKGGSYIDFREQMRHIYETSVIAAEGSGLPLYLIPPNPKSVEDLGTTFLVKAIDEYEGTSKNAHNARAFKKQLTYLEEEQNKAKLQLTSLLEEQKTRKREISAELRMSNERFLEERFNDKIGIEALGHQLPEDHNKTEEVLNK